MSASDAEVVVIGGGAIGVCSAYFLNETGIRVTLVEQKEIAAGSSYGNAGFITPSHFIPLSSPGVIKKGLRWLLNPESPFYIKPRLDPAFLSWLWQFRKHATERHVQATMGYLRDINLLSRELYLEIARRTTLDFGLQTNGLLMLYHSPAGQHDCANMAALAEQIGEPAEIVDNQRIGELDPALETRAAGGLYFPRDAHINPARFVIRLAEYLQTQGVRILTRTHVESFRAANGQITAVKTNRGDISCQQVVLAGGAWSPLVSETLGLQLPVQPAKGYSVTIPQPSPHQQLPLILTEAKVAVTPLGNEIRFGGTLELAGISHTINRRRVVAILKAVPRYIGRFDDVQVDPATAWSGLRPCTPDGLPIVGRSPRHSNLFIATGHAMIGISLAPFTGKIISQLIADKEPEMNIDPLKVERFYL